MPSAAVITGIIDGDVRVGGVGVEITPVAAPEAIVP